MLQKFKLHVTFIPEICTCYLLHNLFKFKNEANIARLLCIMEMETSPQKRQQHTLINTIEDIGNQSHVEGREKFGNAI
jgi:hypothetical protein